MATTTAVAAVIAVTVIAGCERRGACILPTQTRSGGASEVCFYQTEKTCLATPPAASGEKPPTWLPRRTCQEEGFRCAGTGWGTGSRRLQPDGTCPPHSEGPF